MTGHSRETRVDPGDGPQLQRWAQLSPDGEAVATTPARSGALTAQLAGRYLHSRMDPMREAKRQAERIIADIDESDSATRPDGIVCVGVGLGFLAAAFDDLRREGRHALPVIGVVLHHGLVACLVGEDGAPRGYGGSFDRLLPGDPADAIIESLRGEGIDRPYVAENAGEASACPDLAAVVRGTIAAYMQRTRVNRNTLRRFGQLWVRNALRNLDRMASISGIDGLADAASGLPVLVCGAGPTLDEALPHVARIAQHALVIAVDTALLPLQRIGVEPDIAVVADPQYWNTRHLDSCAGHAALLIVEPATHPRVLRLRPAAVAAGASLFPLGEFVDRRLARHVRLGAGGSVATSAWDLARVMGAAHIALAGIDLGFPGSRTHCSGSFFEERICAHGTRLRPAEHMLARYLHGANPQRVASADGDTVLSDERMAVYRAWFDEQLTRPSAPPTSLLSGRSSRIAGATHVPPEDWPPHMTGDEPFTADSSAALGRAREALAAVAATAPAGLPDGNRLRDELDSAMTELELLADVGVAMCANESTGLAELDAMDQRLMGSSARDVAGFIITDTLKQVTAKAPGSVGEAVTQALEIYRSVGEAARLHREILKRRV